MVKDFTLWSIPKLVFGFGKLSMLPALVKGFGSKILILTGKESFSKSRHAGALFDDFKRSKVALFTEHIDHEPSPGMVDDLVKRYSGMNLEIVVSIGGGSVIDAGKAVSAMLPLLEPVREYLDGIGPKHHPGIKVPFIAVPTTAGTGSETTGNAVLSETGPHGFKRSLRHEHFVPEVALVDPVLSMSCPQQQTALSGMDAFSQLLESFLSSRCNSFTDALAFEGIMHVRKSLKRAVSDTGDAEAHAGMSYAAMLSGITLANAGLGLVHGFASSIGGLKDIPHGVVCGTMMGIVNRLGIEKLLKSNEPSEALHKYMRLGKMLSEDDGRSDVDYAFFVANYIETLVDEMKIPPLGEYGLTEGDIDSIAQATDHKNNPVVFSPDELKEMLRKRL